MSRRENFCTSRGVLRETSSSSMPLGHVPATVFLCVYKLWICSCRLCLWICCELSLYSFVFLATCLRYMALLCGSPAWPLVRTTSDFCRWCMSLQRVLKAWGERDMPSTGTQKQCQWNHIKRQFYRTNGNRLNEIQSDNLFTHTNNNNNPNFSISQASLYVQIC